MENTTQENKKDDIGTVSPTGQSGVVPATGGTQPAGLTATDALLARLEELERKDAANQKQIAMLTEVADRGRVMNYEASHNQKKALRINLSKYDGGVIVGWRTVKDELVKHPTTGKIVGESQQYEILVSKPDGSLAKFLLDGYNSFSDARYTERFEAEVVSKSEDMNGKLTFTVRADDGRSIQIDSRFAN